MTKCHICGGAMTAKTVDFPFRTGDRSIVIIKDIPALECGSCQEYLLVDGVMEKVETVLGGVAATAELEVVRYAA